MTSVQVTSQINIELDQLLNGVAQLETDELEEFVAQVSLLLARRKVANLPQPEAALLQQINQGLPVDVQRRYSELKAKQHAETLTLENHEELLALIDAVEQADGDRLQHLIELAQLRQVPLRELMHQLGIHPPAVHA